MYTLYPVLELLVSSTGPSLAGFNENAEPVYSDEPIALDIAEDIVKAQEGLLEYFKEYLERAGSLDALPDLKLCDDILQIGGNENLKTIPFLNYEYYDEFYQRKYYLPLPENSN